MHPVPISLIRTHRDPDIDEVEAIRLLKHYGETLYPGVSLAPIETTGSREMTEGTADEMEARGILYIGIGRGKFDEHPSEERARVENECAATLVAKYIGADRIPSAKANIEYALKKNYSAETAEFEIAPLSKLALRYLAHSGDSEKDKAAEKKVLDATLFFLNAAEENERARLEGRELPQASTSFDEIVSSWFMDSFGKTQADIKKAGGMVFYWILQYAKKHKTPLNTPDTRFELADLAAYAERQGQPLAEIKEYAYVFLDAVWHKYENFFIHCKKDFNSPLTRVAQLQRGEEVLNVTSVVSDNPEIARYARSKYGNEAAVVIKRSPATGNMQVFFNQKFGLDPKFVAKKLRLAELAKQGITEIPGDDVLLSQGKIKGAEVWFFDGYQLLNGSNTADEVPTALTREEAEKAVMKGLRSIPGIV